MIDHKEIKIISLALKYKSDQFNAIDVGGFNGHWTDAVINLNEQSKITIFEPDQDNLLVLINEEVLRNMEYEYNKVYNFLNLDNYKGNYELEYVSNDKSVIHKKLYEIVTYQG